MNDNHNSDVKQKDILREVYFYFCMRERLETQEENRIIIVLMKPRDKESSIFIAVDYESVAKRANDYSSGKVFDLFLSRIDDLGIETIRKKSPLCRSLFVPRIYYNQLKDKIDVFIDQEFDVSYYLASRVKQSDNLIQSSDSLKQFVLSQIPQNDSVKTLNYLIKNNVFCRNSEGDVDFTPVGKTLFLNKTTFKIGNVSRINAIEYVSETTIDLPIYESVDKITDFVFEKIPIVQIRRGIASQQSKAFEKEDIKDALLLALSSADYDSHKDFVIKISDLFIGFEFPTKGRTTAMSNFLKKFFDLKQVKTLKDRINEHGSYFKISKKDNLLSVFISCFSRVSRSSDDEMDDIDLGILSQAKKVDYLSRSDVDKMFMISNRNSNARLNRLVENKLLIKVGRGKSTKYIFNDK